MPAMAAIGGRRSTVSHHGVMCDPSSSSSHALGLHAPNVAPIAALFCRNPGLLPPLSLLLELDAVVGAASTKVVIVTTPPSARVETTREGER